MNEKIELEVGKTYRVRYPFILEKVELYSEDGPYETTTWRPGTRRGIDLYDEFTVADEDGEMLLTIVSRHKPGNFSERIFYTRQWADPNGRVFGKTNLRVTASTAFKRMLRGYRHPYDVTGIKVAA